MRNPQRNPQAYDSGPTLCAWCARKLPPEPQPGTPAFAGFCNDRPCQAAYAQWAATDGGKYPQTGQQPEDW